MPEATAVEQREALHSKQRLATEVVEAAGKDLDFSRKSVLEKLGATDVADAVVKFRALNRECETLGEEIIREEVKAAARAVRDRDEELRRPANDPNHGTDNPSRTKSWGYQFAESREFKASRGRRDVEIEIDIDLKTLFQTSAGFAPESVRSGLVVPGVTRPIQVTDLIPMFTITQPAFKYMEETTRTHASAEKGEGVAYAESTFVFTERSSPVEKITDSIPVTDEQLEDIDSAASLLDQRLSFGVRQRLDGQIVVGNGTPPNLRGLVNVSGIQTQAKGSDPVIATFLRALTKVRVTGRAQPNGGIFHPNDWLDVILTQNSNGDYLFGNPFQGAAPNTLFGIRISECDAITENTGLVADFINFTRLDVKRGVTVATGYVGSNFTEGKKTMRADMRAAFTVTRPAAVCTLTGI